MITPYAYQVELVEKEVSTMRLGGKVHVEVKTLDGFQGR